MNEDIELKFHSNETDANANSNAIIALLCDSLHFVKLPTIMIAEFCYCCCEFAKILYAPRNKQHFPVQKYLCFVYEYA